jgi:hypothetical protein
VLQALVAKECLNLIATKDKKSPAASILNSLSTKNQVAEIKLDLDGKKDPSTTKVVLFYNKVSILYCL